MSSFSFLKRQIVRPVFIICQNEVEYNNYFSEYAWVLPIYNSMLWRASLAEKTSGFNEAVQQTKLPHPLYGHVFTGNKISCEYSNYEYLYIPGEFCRQADVLQAASELVKPIFLERGAFLSPADLHAAIVRLKNAPALYLVEAGSAFGAGQRVCDALALSYINALNYPWGINLSAILQGYSAYPHKPSWSNPSQYALDLIKIAKHLSASFFIIDTTCQAENLELTFQLIEATKP